MKTGAGNTWVSKNCKETTRSLQQNSEAETEEEEEEEEGCRYLMVQLAVLTGMQARAVGQLNM